MVYPWEEKNRGLPLTSPIMLCFKLHRTQKVMKWKNLFCSSMPTTRMIPRNPFWDTCSMKLTKNSFRIQDFLRCDQHLNKRTIILFFSHCWPLPSHPPSLGQCGRMQSFRLIMRWHILMLLSGFRTDSRIFPAVSLLLLFFYQRTTA